jgi:hypothetical protein
MKRISRSHAFYTRVYPVLLCIALLVFTIEWGTDIAFNGSNRSIVEVLVGWAVGAFMSALLRLRTYALADEVLDAGDYLLVRMGAKSARVPITDIERVHERLSSKFYRVELKLMWPGPLGSVITFLPAGHLSFLIPFVKSVVAEDLARRVERGHQEVRRSDLA